MAMDVNIISLCANMTPPKEAEIRKRLEAATPGEWSIPGFNEDGTTAVQGPEFFHECGNCGFVLQTNQVPIGSIDDAQFIANSKTDTSYLLTELSELRKAVRWCNTYTICSETIEEHCECILTEDSHDKTDKHHAQILLNAINEEVGG